MHVGDLSFCGWGSKGVYQGDELAMKPNILNMTFMHLTI
jgi:hypothetical protein